MFRLRNLTLSELFVTALIILLPADFFLGQQAPSARAAPNILLILADDLGYGDLSSYGATDLQTPHIDRLMKSGIRLDEFYANCPVCSPTRAALLTGRYPELVGVPGVIRTRATNNWGYLSTRAVMLPELLKRADYHSAIIGKWHLGLSLPNVPNRRGFDFFHGFLGDMMDDYYNHRRHDNNYMRLNDQVITPQGHATDLFSDWASEYLRERVQKKNPFFLYLAYNAPHTPIQPPDQWLEKVKKREPQITEKRAKLVALIEHLDDGIGRVLKTLQDTKLDKNTLVIFTSDNGGQVSVGANNGALRDGKQSMYEGGIKVPMCAVWPGKIPQGSRNDEVAMTMDLFPTICVAAGVPITHHIEGRSILSAMLGQLPQVEPRDFFFHRREGGNRYAGLTIHAIRRGHWKLLQNSPFAPLELYNLRDDPQEKNNLADTNREKYNELLRCLQVQIQRGGAVPWQHPVRQFTP